MKKLALSVFVAIVAVAAWAAGESATMNHTATNAADMKWSPGPPNLPAGIKVTVLAGDPTKEGELYTIRALFPDGTKVPPHWHPGAENITVISGTFHLGSGDTYDAAHTQALTAGAFAMMPAKMHHFAWAEGETILQGHGIGPFQTFYVNPADDPSKTIAATPKP